MITQLNKYKEFLDTGTNEGLRYNDETKSRFVSFTKCLEILSDRQGMAPLAPIIIELGTCRSFVDGKFEGCNSDEEKYWQPDNPEYWDWGAGCFSTMMRMCLPLANIITVDLIKNHLDRCMHMHDTLFDEYLVLRAGTPSFSSLDYTFGSETRFIASDSVAFLNDYILDTKNRLPDPRGKADFIYLDTGDMWPIQPTCELQLAEAKAIVENDILAPGGILLIDDVLNGTPREQGDVNNKLGKSELSIPYLLANGFEIVFEGYQYILQKK